MPGFPTFRGLAHAFLLVLASLCLGRSVAADDRLEEIIQNVAANEALYENIEIVIEERYRWVGPEDDPGYQAGMPMLAIDGEARYVYQDGLIYHQSDRAQTMFPPDDSVDPYAAPAPGLGAPRDTSRRVTVDSNLTLGYDGERTLCVDESVANIHVGRHAPRELVRAHSMIFLGAPSLMRPLSEYLTAAEINGNKHRVVYKGEEDVDGLNCFHLCSEIGYSEDADPDLYHLWLATDRNYLPVKYECIVPAYSRTVPLAVYTLGDLEELSAGVWFPMAQTRVKNGEIAASEGRTVPHIHTEHTVTKVELDPHYDLSLFQNVPIPDGMPVVEIQDEEPQRGYIQGVPVPPRRWSWWWLVVVVAGALLFVAWRKRERIGAWIR